MTRRNPRSEDQQIQSLRANESNLQSLLVRDSLLCGHAPSGARASWHYACDSGEIGRQIPDASADQGRDSQSADTRSGKFDLQPFQTGFAFRKFSPTLRWAQVAGVVFATASLATPFFLGTIAGSIASGRVTTESSGELWSSWLNPTSVLGGVLALATCTYLAGVLLTADAAKLGETELATELRPKVLLGGVITGTIALIGIPVALIDASDLADGLVSEGLALALLSGAAGLAAMWQLWRSSYRMARISAAVAVATVLAAWGVAQYPWVLMESTTIDEAAGAHPTLVGLLIATALAAVFVVPPLLYLLHLADSNRVGTLEPTNSLDQ